jgi:hypothetical protein
MYVLTGTTSRLCEAGFIPAGLFTITRWYKRDETTTRFSWYFIGNLFAAACSGLVAYGMWVLPDITHNEFQSRRTK